MRRAAAIALAALAASAAPARAQFRARPMVIPAPAAGTDVLAQPFVTAPGAGEAELADLLLARSGAAASLRRHHALLSPLASPFAQPASFRCVAAGRLAENAEDALPDVAYCAGLGDEIQVAFGSAPGVLRSYTHVLSVSQGPTLAFARLHPPPRRSDVLVFPVDTGFPGTSGWLYALDFGTGTGSPAATDRAWEADGIARGVDDHVVLTMRISPTARTLGIDDLYVAGLGSVTLWAHAAPPAGSTLADVRFGDEVKVGGTAEEGLDPSTWLPPGVSNDEILGAGALDVDLDGDLDLVVALGPSRQSATSPVTGKLLWVERTGDVAALATARPWRDLTAHPDLQPLEDVALLRAIELDRRPALAAFDRGRDEVLVVTADPGAGGLRAWRGGAAGRLLRELRLADVVGSSAPDLVADGTQGGDPAVLVWPDLGDASPELAWAGGSPGTPLRGEDLALGVAARDPDGPFSVDWLVGDPYGAPAASAGGLEGGVAHALSWILDGTLLCDPPPQVIAVTVRATDDLGVFDELAVTSEVGLVPPSLALAGAVPDGRLVLAPGGTVAALEGSASIACGAVAFRWGGTIFGVGADLAADDTPGTTRRILTFDEGDYVPLLASADDPVATLGATDAATGLESPLAQLPLRLDATGLVEVEHEADVVALAPGEATVLRSRVRSRLGVPLAGVRVVDVLAGLVVAGAPRVTGAGVLATAAAGSEVVLDVLPAGGAEVVVELPVRSLGAWSSSSVEVRSSGGHLLTPAARASGEGPTAPGCGCGEGGAGGEALLLALALAAVRSRRRAGPAARAAGGRAAT